MCFMWKAVGRISVPEILWCRGYTNSRIGEVLMCNVVKLIERSLSPSQFVLFGVVFGP